MAQYVGSGRRAGTVSSHGNKPVSKKRKKIKTNTAVVTAEEQVQQYQQVENTTFFGRLVAFFAFVGDAVHDNVTGFFRMILKVLIRGQERRFRAFRKKLAIYISRGFEYVVDLVTYPIVKLSDMFKLIREIMAQTAHMPSGKRMAVLFREIFAKCRSNAKFFTTMLNYVMPLMAVAMFITVIQFVNEKDFAVAPSYNGVRVGYVSDEATMEAANQIVQGRMVYQGDEAPIEFTPTYSLEIVSNKDMLNKYQLADRIIMTATDDVIDAKGLYIDGQFYGAIEDASQLEALLNEKLDSARTDDPTMVVSFAKKVEIVRGVYMNNNLTTADALLEIANRVEAEEQYYTTVKGDTPSKVAGKNQVTLERLKELNPGVNLSKADGKMGTGIRLKTVEATPFLPIQVERNETYTVDVDFPVESEESDKYSQGTVKVLQKGTKGKNEVTAKVTYVNGQKTGQEVLSTTVLKEPVPQKEAIGTKASGRGDWMGSLATSTGSGKIDVGFIWPLSNYNISSAYGKRGWESHGGLDITVRGGSFGAPIKAVAPGKVVFAGNASTWGKLIRVDHGNGLETYYAHCSEFVAKVGDQVAQGQTIAKVGSTGRSTGPHLHLEVRINGKRQNPMTYLP